MIIISFLIIKLKYAKESRNFMGMTKILKNPLKFLNETKTNKTLKLISVEKTEKKIFSGFYS